MRGENLHLTLMFLGDTPAARLAELLALGAAQPPFRCVVRLERAECWKHNRVAVLCPGDCDQALVRLLNGLQQDLDAAGLRFDRRPWRPHATLLRGARCAADALPMEPVEWRASGFALLASRQEASGMRYEVLGHWGGSGALS